MTWWEGVVLGVVQGLTEFLPVSSSGHLVVAQEAMGIRMPGVFVEVTLHVATLLAVVVVYHRRLGELARGLIGMRRDALASIGLLAVATAPAVVVGFFFKDMFERTFDALAVVGVDFLLTGAILWSVRWVAAGARAEPGALGAVGVGVAQALAIMPGISRSGTTVTAGMWLRVDPVKAAEFSFLMAIPAIAGAAVLQIPEVSRETAAVGAAALTASFISALVAGVLAIRLLVRLLARRAFHRFAPYCWVLGAVTLVWALVR